MSKVNIAIFASGSGTNAEAIMKFFQDHQEAQVVSLLSNKPDEFTKKCVDYYFDSTRFRLVSGCRPVGDSQGASGENYFGTGRDERWLIERLAVELGAVA